jgi:2-C-methyl-D-erythritol 4-phosphate cytidylyltransferase
MSTGQSVVPFWVVIPAAGVGERAGSDEPKQYVRLGQKTVLEHSIDKLLAVPGLQGVVVALHSKDTIFDTLGLRQNRKLVTVEGGAERANSVLNALHALEGRLQAKDWVLVHDAARPCVSSEWMAEMVLALADHPVGGIMAVPQSDTLKRVKGDEIVETVSRAGLWRAQTPQMFRYELLRSCLAESLARGVSVTDESVAVEQGGYRPAVFPGEETNIKITHPDDFVTAMRILEQQA